MDSSKIGQNQKALLEKNLVLDSEILIIKTVHAGYGEKETKYLLKKCIDCKEIFYQFLRKDNLYVRCDKCSSGNKKKYIVVSGESLI